MIINNLNTTIMNYKKLMFLISLALIISSAASAQDFKYIGAVKCKVCHNKPDKGKQYDVWMEGPHANAMESLKGDEKTDPKCLKCHSTAASVDKSLHAGIKESEGVSCESCHGPGGNHAKTALRFVDERITDEGLKLLRSTIQRIDHKQCIECHLHAAHKKHPDFDREQPTGKETSRSESTDANFPLAIIWVVGAVEPQ